MPRGCDDDEDYSGSFMMGSLHTLLSKEELGSLPKNNGPRVRMGFHPPEQGWIPQSRKRKPRAK